MALTALFDAVALPLRLAMLVGFECKSNGIGANVIGIGANVKRSLSREMFLESHLAAYRWATTLLHTPGLLDNTKGRLPSPFQNDYCQVTPFQKCVWLLTGGPQPFCTRLGFRTLLQVVFQIPLIYRIPRISTAVLPGYIEIFTAVLPGYIILLNQSSHESKLTGIKQCIMTDFIR